MKRKIKIDALHNLVVNKQHVDEWLITSEAETLYKCLKVTGAKNTVLRYSVAEGKEEEKPCKDVSMEIRALACFICRMIYRWDDKDTRLEQHFALPCAVEEILDMKKITKDDGVHDHNILSVRKVIENYLE